MAKKKKTSAGPPRLEADSSTSATGAYLCVRPGSAVVSLAPAAASQPPPASALLHTHAQLGRSGRAGSTASNKKAVDTAGAAWGHMRAPELTAEAKRELLIVKMRGALDSKRFYRASDNGKGLPKYFQLGTLVEGAEEGVRGRMGKRTRKGSMLQELMTDDAVRKRAKQQFLKSQAEHSAGVKRSARRSGGSISKRRTGRHGKNA